VARISGKEVVRIFGTRINAGKYIVIWKRQPTGGWKIHRDIFNSDVPPAQASTSRKRVRTGRVQRLQRGDVT
jgi:hypothetical protein